MNITALMIPRIDFCKVWCHNDDIVERSQKKQKSWRSSYKNCNNVSFMMHKLDRKQSTRLFEITKNWGIGILQRCRMTCRRARLDQLTRQNGEDHHDSVYNESAQYIREVFDKVRYNETLKILTKISKKIPVNKNIKGTDYNHELLNTMTTTIFIINTTSFKLNTKDWKQNIKKKRATSKSSSWCW